MAYKKSPEELHDNLIEQVQFLRTSCKLYDEGIRSEAKRLASAVYVLLHDAGQQKSLLKMLDYRGKMRFLSAAERHEELEIYVPLLIYSIPDKGGHFEPNFPIIEQSKDNLPRLQFHSWWDEPVYLNGADQNLSRKNLVYALRNQDGGGHVDAALRDAAYRWLILKGAKGAAIPMKGGMTLMWNPMTNPRALENGILNGSMLEMIGGPVKDGHLAIMRVIAWELDETLKSEGF